MTMHPIDMYRKLVDEYGEMNMILMAIEEMSELIKELTKYERVDYDKSNIPQINEEIADVEIVIDELKWLFSNHTAVDEIIETKICRTKARLDERLLRNMEEVL